jgi:hypothetical protein
MNITREQRKKLDALSKEIFGVSSRWQRLLRDGQEQLLTRKTVETIPGVDGKEPTTQEIDAPVLTEYGAKQFYLKQYTIEEVETLLLGYKKQLDDFKEARQKQLEEQAAQKAKEEAIKKVKDAAQGSAAV